MVQIEPRLPSSRSSLQRRQTRVPINANQATSNTKRLTTNCTSKKLQNRAEWTRIDEVRLDSRRLLDSTLVVVKGEMGHTPKINGNAGRDHWPQCGFSLLIGGGVKQGYVQGTTDNVAAWPTSHPVSPADFVATIYKLLGIDPHLTVPDRVGRPIPIAHGGEPVADVIA